MIPWDQIMPLAGVIAGYVGRMFTTEQSFKARLDQFQKDVDAAHQLIRQIKGSPDACKRSLPDGEVRQKDAGTEDKKPGCGRPDCELYAGPRGGTDQ